MGRWLGLSCRSAPQHPCARSRLPVLEGVAFFSSLKVIDSFKLLGWLPLKVRLAPGLVASGPAGAPPPARPRSGAGSQAYIWPAPLFPGNREVALILERRQLLGVWRRAGLQVSSLTNLGGREALWDTHPTITIETSCPWRGHPVFRPGRSGVGKGTGFRLGLGSQPARLFRFSPSEAIETSTDSV